MSVGRPCRRGWRVAAAAVVGLVAAVGAGPAGSLRAQTPDTTADTVVIPLGRVEAAVTRGSLPLERVPGAISSVDAAAAVRARPQVDLHEVLRRVPGVAVDDRHNLALGTRVSIRGFGARSAFGVRGVRMLLDGIPLTLADGQTALTNVDLASLGRVEVIRGPSAVLYGNAAGGVVALSTREAPAGGLVEGRLAAGTGGAGDLSNLVRAHGSAGGGGDRSSWFAGLSLLDLDGYREHGRARRYGGIARYRVAPDPASVLTVIANVASVPVAENPGALPADSVAVDPRMAWPRNVETRSGEAVSQGQAGLGYTRALGAAILELAAHGHARSLENPLPFGRYIRLRRAAGGARAVLRSTPGGAWSWTAGVEAESQHDDRLERENLEGEIGGTTFQDRIDRVTAAAPFALVQVAARPWLELRAGGRYDAVAFRTTDRQDAPGEDRSGERLLDAWSGSVGALVRPPAGFRAWTSASTWFQTPTTTELINAPPDPGAPCCPTGFNPNLRPQDGWGIETGFAGRAADLDWELVAYEIRVRNEILPYQVEGAEGRAFFRNAGRSRHRGLEAAVAFAPVAGLRVEGAYTFSDFRFTRTTDPALEGNRLPGVAPHRLHVELAVDRGAGYGAVDLEWVARYPVDDANTAFNDAYAVVGLRAARRLRAAGLEVEPFAELSNVLDVRYSSSVVINAFGGRYYEPAPGRALLLGVRAALR